MATKIIMPKLGMAMKEGVLARWLKADGDPIAKDEPVAVVMSKKITYTLTSPAAGVLRTVARPNETRVVGATVAFVTAPGEAVPSAELAPEAPEAVAAAARTPAPAAPAAHPAATGFVIATPAARRLAREQGIELGSVPGTGADGMVTEADVTRFAAERAQAAPRAEVLATSAARQLARERGVDLAEIPGTGVGGRVTEQDVQAFLEGRAAPSAPAAAAPAAARVIPFTGMRQAVAEHMVESLHTMAQLTVQTEVDATELVRLRTQLKADFDLTYTDLLVKAAAKALRQHPRLNSTLIGDEIHLLDAIHIGVAVALEDGLIVPVLRDADTRTVREIAEESRRLAQGARQGSLSVDEVTGSTFTITSLGAYGVDGFTPIINSPEVAILGVGRIVEKPVIHEGEIARRSTMVLSLTIDHRVLDGVPAAEFLRTLGELIQSPYRLLI